MPGKLCPRRFDGGDHFDPMAEISPLEKYSRALTMKSGVGKKPPPYVAAPHWSGGRKEVFKTTFPDLRYLSSPIILTSSHLRP